MNNEVTYVLLRIEGDENVASCRLDDYRVPDEAVVEIVTIPVEDDENLGPVIYWP